MSDQPAATKPKPAEQAAGRPHPLSGGRDHPTIGPETDAQREWRKDPRSRMTPLERLQSGLDTIRQAGPVQLLIMAGEYLRTGDVNKAVKRSELGKVGDAGLEVLAPNPELKGLEPVKPSARGRRP